MIIFATTRGNGYTLKSLADRTFGVDLPDFRLTHYERLFGAWRLPRATYIFGDLERLAPWELRTAADLFRSLTARGVRCLNDPARTKARVELLDSLFRDGRNPYNVWRADLAPRPVRFPVFIRTEGDHLKPDDRLYASQSELEDALRRLQASGTPLRGMLAVEYAGEPYREGLWAKWGTWRIGDAMIVEHIAVDDNWLVKTGDHSKVDENIAADERKAVETNRFAEAVRHAFEIGEISFGRADHATVDGRTVVYEINTNPSVPAMPLNEPLSYRRQTLLLARTAIAKALHVIDTHEAGWLKLPATKIRRPIRWWRPGFVTPRRP
jgi:hypothetical protein